MTTGAVAHILEKSWLAAHSSPLPHVCHINIFVLFYCLGCAPEGTQRCRLGAWSYTKRGPCPLAFPSSPWPSPMPTHHLPTLPSTSLSWLPPSEAGSRPVPHSCPLIKVLCSTPPSSGTCVTPIIIIPGEHVSDGVFWSRREVHSSAGSMV